MKLIDYNNIQPNHYYYIHKTDENKKYYGKFTKIYDYQYFYIVIFQEVSMIPYLSYTNIPPLELHFVINNYHDGQIQFFIPEAETFMCRQILRQKTMDENLANVFTALPG